MEQLISCTTATINCKAVRMYVLAEKKVALIRIFFSSHGQKLEFNEISINGLVRKKQQS